MRWCVLVLFAIATLVAPAAARDVLVTIDDVPLTGGEADLAVRARTTDALLAVLKKHGIQAIAFVTLSRRASPAEDALIRKWRAAGHVLGNHSDRHLSYTHTDQAAWLADVERARAAISALNGAPVTYFRFPFLREGHTEARLDAARAWLQQTGQRAVPVTLNLQDWRYEAPWRAATTDVARAAITADYQAEMRQVIRADAAVGDRVMGHETPQILLLHAMTVSAGQWDALFTWMAAEGYRFVGPEAALAHPDFATPHRYVAPFGTSYWRRLKAERMRTKTTAAVLDLLDTQVRAWNRGDLGAFCAIYADDALFISPKGLTQGRAAVEARYRTRYPDKAAMGELSLEVVETRPAEGSEFTLLGSAQPSRVHGLSVAARWTLRYPGKPAVSGHTLIVFRRIGTEWKIVQDASM